jgi:hypothetical protein
LSYNPTAGFPNKNDPSSTTSRYQSKKKISILVAVIITALTVDMTFSTFSDILKEQLVSFWGLVLFTTTILTIYGAGQYFLLGFLKQMSNGVRSKAPYFDKLYNLLTIAQYIIGGILLLIIFQVFLTSHYYILLTIAATTISYALACIIMTLVSYRFFSWYKSNKDNTVLLYALASAMVAISTGSHLLTHNIILLEKKPFEIDANLKQDFPEISQSTIGIIANVFLYANVLPLLLSFVLMYAGTILLLRHHSKKLGKIKFWIIICLPLISFLAGLLPTLLALPSGGFTFYSRNFVVFRVFSILSGTIGSILIGIAFLAIARTIRKVQQNGIIVDYLAIAGYGIMMLAISIETPMYQAPYPPFGVAASASIGLMCYLYGVGIYLSAISVSEDVKLRQAIRQYVIDESKLLDSIGTAEMEQQIEKAVSKITKEQEEVLAEQTGVEPSLTEGEVKDYVETVLLEVKQMHNNDKEQQ